MILKRRGGIILPWITATNIDNVYSEKVGFYSIEYGNSMPDKEREQHANRFYQAIVDLEELTGLNVKKINQYGKLGIGFGTRGGAGHAATYFGGYRIINLSRKSGDGSLAHEYGHYIDDILSKVAGKKQKVNGSLGHFASQSGAKDGGINDALQAIMRRIYKGESSVEVTFKAQKKYSYRIGKHDTVESAINYVKSRINSYKKNAYQKQIFGYIADKFGLPSVTVTLPLKGSRYYANCRAMGSDYWVEEVELFARVWESYIWLKMEKTGVFNNYLQSNPYTKFIGMGIGPPFPEGQEAEDFYVLTENLVQAMRNNLKMASTTVFEGERVDENEAITLVEKVIENEPNLFEHPVMVSSETVNIQHKMKNEKDMILGKKINLRLPNKETRKAQFAIIELDSIIPSHNPKTFASHPDFPMNESGFNINDRNYGSDPQAQALVQQYAQELRPELLITTSKTPQGSPIITKDNIVVSGNNRTMSMQLAAMNYPERYEAYKQELKEEFAAFGFEEDMTILDTFDKPVFVRVDYDFPAYTTEEMAKYNQSEVKGKRPVDKAIELSSILVENKSCSISIPSILANYERLSDFYANRSDQKRMMDLLLGCNLLTEQETASYYDLESGFTSAGKDFLEATLAASILDREAILAADKAGVKSFRRIIVTSLPTLMANKGLGNDRLTACINNAVIYQMELQASGLKFIEYINQQALFEKRIFDVKAIYLNRLMHSGRNKFKKAIEGYNNTVKINQGASLFGEAPDSKEAFEFYIVNAIPDAEKRFITQFKGEVSNGSCGLKTKPIPIKEAPIKQPLPKRDKVTEIKVVIKGFEVALKRAKGDRKEKIVQVIKGFKVALKVAKKAA